MALVATHDFNTLWLGDPFGIAFGPKLLTLSAPELHSISEGYKWIEVRCDVSDLPSDQLLPANGLIHVDTQLGYSLSMRQPAVNSSHLFVEPIRQEAFDQDRLDFAPFSAERYLRLAAVDAENLDLRYQLWARHAMSENPHLCLTVWNVDALVGYSFARPISETKLNLELVAASTINNVPGLAIYAACLRHYSSLGYRTAVASFSARNLAAVNVHASLRCRFTSATDIWLLEKEGSAD